MKISSNSILLRHSVLSLIISLLCGIFLTNVVKAGQLVWDSQGAQDNCYRMSLSTDGSILAFESTKKANLGGDQLNGNIFVKKSGNISVASQGFWTDAYYPTVSSNGAWVGFFGVQYFPSYGGYVYKTSDKSVTFDTSYMNTIAVAVSDAGKIVAYLTTDSKKIFINGIEAGSATSKPVCSANGNRVAFFNGSTVRVFDNGTQKYSANANSSSTEAPALSANGAYVAYQTSSTQVSSFNLDNNNARIDYAGTAPVALSADGTLLACKNGTGVTLYNTADGSTVGAYANVNPTELALAKTLTGMKLAFVTTDKLAGDTGSYSDVYTWSNTAPVASDVTKTTNEDTPVSITLNGTDADNDPLTYSIVSGPDAAKGTLGTLAGNTVTFTPTTDFVGDATFTYKVTDNAGFASAPATVTITVSQVNDMPTFVKGADVTVDEDSGAYDVQWATDVWAGAKGDTYENGQTLTMNTTLNSGATLFAVAPKFVVNADHTANLQFTLNPNVSGFALMSVTLSDGDKTTTLVIAKITVNEINDTPSFTMGADQVVDEDCGAESVVGWAKDISAGTNETGQTVTFTVTNDNNALFLVQPMIDATGTLTYAVKPDANGMANVKVVLKDSNTPPAETAEQSFKITVNAVNDAPKAAAVSAETNEDTATTITLDGSDIDSTGLTYSIVSGPTAEQGTLGAINADQVTFTPAANYNGTATFTYQAYDGALNSAAATVTITVKPVNDAPKAAAVSAETDEDTATTITLDGSDIDSTGLTYSIVSGPTAEQGTLGAINGNQVTFTPTANFDGTATFTYKANDGALDSTEATVTITVKPVNDAPVLAPISAKSTYRNVALADIPLTVTDVDDDVSAVKLSWAPKDASGIVQDVAFPGTTRMTITPALDKVGTTTITITATDDDGAQSSQDVTVTVKQTYIVTPSADLGGAISPNTTSVVLPNGYAFFTATPDKANNYGVDAWYVNDAQAQIGGLTYDLSKINADTAVRVTFKQDFPAPTVDAVTGFNDPQENVGQASITITGNNFRSGAHVYLTNGDETQTITAADVVASADGTQLTCSFNLARNATDLPWALVVTNDDGKSVTKSPAVTLTAAAPHVTKVVPATGQTGHQVAVDIYGYGFAAGATVELQRTGKTPVDFTTVIFYDKTHLSGTVQLPATELPTQADQWKVVVTVDGTPSTDDVFLTVGPNPAPTVTGISPTSAQKTADGGTVDITITGTEFSASPTVTLHPTGVTDTDKTDDVILPTPPMASATQLDWAGLSLAIIPTGKWDVIVTNADGQSAKLPGAFTVSPADLESVALKTDRPDYQPIGSTIVLSAVKTGSAKDVEYAFFAKYFNASIQQWVEIPLRSYSTNASFTWKPTIPANYQLYVKARKVGVTTVDYQVISPETFFRVIDGSIASVAITVAPNAANGTVALTASKTGTAVNVEYRFGAYFVDPVTKALVYQDLRGYDTNGQYLWTPTVSGQYYIGVAARVVGSTASYQKQSSYKLYTISAKQ